jgi:hypothetical protein
MRQCCFGVFVLSGILSACCHAAQVAYEFVGTEQYALSDPYGLQVTDSAPVVGRFIYDTASPMTYAIPGCDCAGYRQQIPNGFIARIGDITIATDNYDIEVFNDTNPSGSNPSDVFTVVYSSDSVVPLTFPLVVNNAPHTTGLFGISFVDFSASVYSDHSLPPTVDLGQFQFSNGFFSDDPDSSGVGFSVDTLEPVSSRAGDYNLDGKVQPDDYQIWKASFGSEANLAADGNLDGVIDAADYTVWRDRLTVEGNSSSSTGPHQAPEPTSAFLLLCGVPFFACAIRRRPK